MIWFDKVLYVIVWFDIIWYGSATMLKNVDSIIWQKAGATIWQNAGNIIISYFVVWYEFKRLDLVW